MVSHGYKERGIREKNKGGAASKGNRLSHARIGALVERLGPPYKIGGEVNEANA